MSKELDRMMPPPGFIYTNVGKTVTRDEPAMMSVADAWQKRDEEVGDTIELHAKLIATEKAHIAQMNLSVFLQDKLNAAEQRVQKLEAWIASDAASIERRKNEDEVAERGG